MSADRTAAVEAILAATEAAHGAYEATVLHGVYDQAWAAWYAAHAVDHGIGEALGRPIAADQLATAFTTAWEARSASGGATSEPWASWMASRLVAGG